MLTIIHDIYFPLVHDPSPKPDELAALQSSSCVYRLLFVSGNGDLYDEAFRRTVSRVTLDGIATRFTELFSTRRGLTCAIAICHLDMMTSACYLPELARKLQFRLVHDKAVGAIWRLLGQPEPTTDWELCASTLFGMIKRIVHAWIHCSLL